MFASKLEGILNTHSSSPHISLQSSIQSSVTASHIICDVEFSEDDVLDALSHLNSGKSDGDGIFSEYLIYASSAVMAPLAIFFSSLVCHGFMPQCLRDCVLVPVPKKNKDAACSVNYRPIALSSCLSKILEHFIMSKYSAYLYSSSLQFGFKPRFPTTLCSGVVKNVVSRYIMVLMFMVVFLMQARLLTS